ncbi:unnamed protein product [Auanema sp. JU1783]|nr:unnamed protein product [Auanema sp. JU1783]
MGFGVELEPESLYSLRSHYLPLGKIGGRPSWLSPKNIPTSSQLECQSCKKAMCFLIQIYATKDDDPVHSFHRTLFVFVCRNPECSKPNDASNLKVFRCVLPRKNPFYSENNAMDPDLDGDVPDPYYPADAPKLCRTCGCYASKKCAKCGEAWYCCRDHQSLDWVTGHRTNCGTPASETDIPKNPANSFVFKEFGIELDQEYAPANIFDDISDDDDDEDGEDTDDEGEEERKRRLKEFQNFVKTQKGKNEDITVEDCESAVGDQTKDDSFEKFNRLINLNPEQIVRYQRYGNPLKATNHATPIPDMVPPCNVCNSPRRFEFQLTPHLLSLIEVDSIGKSIDWASVYVFTCASSCEIPEMGYAEEFVCKQDFK